MSNKRKFTRGQTVVIVANDDPNLQHGWETWKGTYVKHLSGKRKGKHLATEHLVAIAHDKEDVRLVEFFDDEIKHTWEV